jgi:hypothetical protein
LFLLPVGFLLVSFHSILANILSPWSAAPVFEGAAG